jgi:CheY-like chemotaxis protein
MTALPPSPPPLRVLLLDDDNFTLEIMADMLADAGDFDVHCETDARRALTTLAGERPALLICDLSMPDMDGIEFMRAAAEAGFQGSVMLLSGMDAGVRRAAERLARSNGLKVLGAWQKPISAPDLRSALATLAAGAPGGDENLYNLTTHLGK